MNKTCKKHPEKKATNFCHNCGDYYCEDCLEAGSIYYYCKKEECQSKLQEELLNNKQVEINKILDKNEKFNSFMFGHIKQFNKMLGISVFIIIILLVLFGYSNLGFFGFAAYALSLLPRLFIIPFLIAYPSAFIVRLFNKQLSPKVYINIFQLVWIILLAKDILDIIEIYVTSSK